MNSKIRYFLVFIVGFAIYFYIDANLFSTIQKEVKLLTHSKAIGHVVAYAVTLIPLIITVAILHHNYLSILKKLGLSKNLYTGISFAFLSTLPMLIGYSIKFNLNEELSFETIIINTISSAFFEEIIYRAFLFGMLYRFTRLGFLPSMFLGSLLFGIAHLYQSTDINELVGIFLLTFLGSVLFNWIYSEWQFNLWTAIFLHCLMNFYWLIYDVDSNALGGTYANIFRFSSVFMAIFGTVVYKRKKKESFEITRKTWWMKSKNYSE
jgi:membrane protease YdiL (CAAX protease family)